MRFRKQLVVPEPDPVGILLPGILDTHMFAAPEQKTPSRIFFPWILWKNVWETVTVNLGALH